MRIILLVIAVLSFGIVSAQQINPIPDYVFKNQMSVGRNSTTDTAAYMSIGPRFGATKGMMPPMVVDTATFSGSKRNGLLIFSVQKNKFLYWDSVRVQWSDMAGSSGQYITGTVTSGKIPKATSSTVITDSRMSESGLLVSAPRLKADSMLFLPKMSTTPTDTGAIRYALADSVIYVWTGSQWIKAGAGGTVTSITAGTGLSGGTITSSGTIAVDTATIATRARVQKGIDSLGEITVKLTGGQTIAGNKIFSNDITFNAGSYFKGSLLLYNPDDAIGYNQLKSKSTAVNFRTIYFPNDSGTVILDKTLSSYIGSSFISGTTNYVPKFTGTSAIGNSIAYDNGTELLINTTSDAGAYTLQNSGAFYNTGSAILAATSGTVGIGTTLTTGKLNFENTTAVVTDGIIFTASNGAGTNHGFRIGINRQARAEVASSIKFLAENYSNNDNTYITFGTGFNDAERMRITSDGRILAGTTSAFSGGLNEQRIQSYGTDDLAGFSALRVSANTGGSRFVLAKSRGATYTIVNNNDGLGIISFQGADGSTLYRSAEISGQVDGTPSAGSVPGRLVFETNMSERMRIKSDGEVLIGTTSDAGFYPLQVSGNIYNTNDAHFSVTGGGVGIGIGSSPSKLWIYGGSLSTSSTGGSGFASRLTTGRTGTFDANTLTSFHNYFDSESIEIASGSSNTYVSGISVTGRSATNYSGSVRFITSSSERMRINPDGELLVNTTTDAGAYALQVSGAIYNTTTITTGAPTSGTAKPWRLGEAATVSPTSPNRTIRVEIDGTVYYIHAKTTND